MTQSYVTQCPHCRTSFRVNTTQLTAAHGAVRCGACLHVFNAAQQLRESGALTSAAAPQAASKPALAAAPPQSQAAQPAAARPAAPAPAPAPAAPSQTASKSKNEDTLWIHDDLDLDDLDLDEELAKLEAEEQQFSRQFLAAEAAPRLGEQLLQAGTSEPEVDESWAQALLRDTPAQPKPAVPAPTPVPSPATAKPVEASTASPADGAPAPLGEAPEPLETSGLSAEISDRRGNRPQPRSPAQAPEVQSEAETEDETLDDQPAAGKARRSEPALRDEHLFELDDEPLQLDWRPQQRKPWGRWLGWGLLNLLAASALAGQYVAYNFEQLARQDQYRPWFEQLCPAIGCQLPSKVDISQIKSSNLVVRSHPQFSGALVVDAILYNRAPFTQPFPLLEMRFADINGQLLASRRFKPGEYLAGELAGQAQMPPQTPIHISMDILDPGAQAVNYSLSFHSPE